MKSEKYQQRDNLDLDIGNAEGEGFGVTTYSEKPINEGSIEARPPSFPDSGDVFDNSYVLQQLRRKTKSLQKRYAVPAFNPIRIISSILRPTLRSHEWNRKKTYEDSGKIEVDNDILKAVDEGYPHLP